MSLEESEQSGPICRPQFTLESPFPDLTILTSSLTPAPTSFFPLLKVQKDHSEVETNRLHAKDEGKRLLAITLTPQEA